MKIETLRLFPTFPKLQIADFTMFNFEIRSDLVGHYVFGLLPDLAGGGSILLKF